MGTTFEDLDNPKTFLPGVAAKRVTISSACRRNRTDLGAQLEAISQIDEELGRLLASWPVEKGATFHLVLTVDRQGRGPDTLG